MGWFWETDSERRHRELMAAISEGFDKMKVQYDRVIANVAALKNVVAASNAAWDIADQFARDQAEKIAALEEKVAAGGAVTTEDIAALSTANDEFEAAIPKIRTAVPAGTPQA